MKYAIIALVVFAILSFLKYCEGTPVRSWKMVGLAGVPISLLLCYYAGHALPRPRPRQTQTERVAVNRAELARDFSHMAGVNQAVIDGRIVRIDLAAGKSPDEIKNFARQIAGTSAYFLSPDQTNLVTVLISVNGQQRYELNYRGRAGIVDETSY